MEFISFEIKDFKGIEHIEIDFSKRPSGSIYTLVGLNESGKTTVLEAISFFNTKENELETLYQQGFRLADMNELVPMKKKANFNGPIQITATLRLNESDKEDITKFGRELGYRINREKLSDTFSVTRKLEFENSIYDADSSISEWDIDIQARPKRAKIDKRLIDIDKNKWDQLIKHIRSKFPSILYFPTFLFEFPSRIYLQNHLNENPKNVYYRLIIQDILDSLDDDLTVNEHIVNRVIDGGIYQKRSLDTVLNRMANIVSKTVFESWNEVFDKRIPKKEIVITYGIEELEKGEQTEKRVYLEFQIKDGDSLYLITDRSLGFRWFFCFLLFTQFRSYRKTQSNTLFLLDEPASNLHSKAQMQLLSSFTKITENSGKIIYSTHSHYMINPQWLENTFIVRNEGLNYDKEQSEYEYSSRETNIKIENYRQFVGENPDKETYFQPILDTLDYVPSNLELVNDAIFVEGKNDFYVLKYFESIVFKNKKALHIIPGTGAGKLDTLIALYLGWGKKFIIVLDDDDAGRAEKERYKEEWLLSDTNILTLSDINENFIGYTIEELIDRKDRIELKNEFFPGRKNHKISKKELARILQEKLLKKAKTNFTESTINNFKSLISTVKSRFSQTS